MPRRCRYAGFAAWQRKCCANSRVWERQLDYWKGALAGAPPLLELPTDRARPDVFSFRHDVIEVSS